MSTGCIHVPKVLNEILHPRINFSDHFTTRAVTRTFKTSTASSFPVRYNILLAEEHYI